MDSLPWITMTTVCVTITCLLHSLHAEVSGVNNAMGVKQDSYAIACLMEDQDEELFLNCSRESNIYIRRAVHGKQPPAQDSQPCGYLAQNDCSMEAPELETMMDMCMGQPNCNTPVKKQFIPNCGETSNYVQVDFTCIPERIEDTVNIFDICGDILGTDTLIKPSGYIETPNYPEVYPPDVSCSCNLSVMVRDAQIKLTLLDLELEMSPEQDVCHWDWLEFLSYGEIWGSGRKMCSLKDAPTVYEAKSGHVQINFKSDSKRERRGFWLKFEGSMPTGEPANVKLQCKEHRPVIMKEAIQCFPSQKAALPLDCDGVGVIDIMTARHGYRKNSTRPCEYSILDDCGSDMTSDPTMMENCMGQVKCSIPATRVPLQECNTDSDYLQVRYQCIPETRDVGNIMDVCGNNIEHRLVSRRGGFIESLKYPHHYPPYTKCQCQLVTDERAIVHFEIMDMQIARQEGEKKCSSDWLEYTLSPGKRGSGTKLCQMSAGDIVNTTNKNVYLNFLSDGMTEDRGFWIKYFGVRKDGSRVPVRVKCNTWQAIDAQTAGNNPDAIENLEGRKPNIGLIIGLVAIAVLIILLLLAIVIYRIRKSSLKSTKMPDSPVGAVPTTSATQDYSSLKKYAAFAGKGKPAEPYDTLQNSSSSNNSSLRESDTAQANNSYTDFIERNPDYDHEPYYSSNLPTSYMNKAYDGTVDNGVFTSEASQDAYNIRI